MAENYRIMQSKREGEDFVRNSVAITGAAVWSDEVGGITIFIGLVVATVKVTML